MIRVTLLAVTLLGLSEFNYHYLCHHVFIIKRLLGPGNHLGVSGFIQSWVEVHTEFSPLVMSRIYFVYSACADESELAYVCALMMFSCFSNFIVCIIRLNGGD